MYEEIPSNKEIRFFSCGLNGRNHNTEEITPINHMFIILSKNQYNENNEFVLAVPISSEKPNDENSENEFATSRMKYGINIDNADLDGLEASNYLKPEKTSLVLCDRITRIKKEDSNNHSINTTLVKKEKYEEIIKSVNNFIKIGKIKKS